MELLADLDPTWDADIHRNWPGAFADHVALQFRLYERTLRKWQAKFLHAPETIVGANMEELAVTALPQTLSHPNPADSENLVVQRLSAPRLEDLQAANRISVEERFIIEEDPTKQFAIEIDDGGGPRHDPQSSD